MRTLLSQFCEEFDSAVRPFLEPLRRAAETLGEDPGSPHARAVLPGLIDVADQFTVLADKVAEQQAYVLIFGPLKSGKSTLMNAMSAAYVSEVTSLPAYPCMVYVSDSDQRKFTVTRYNGDLEVFQDPAALRMQVARAHNELADRIRKVEAEGIEFDPLQHFDEAIRRVDVKVPAGELAHSGSVLVDTPGLYSRMKFGYDRMTKEFRNAAACAIFVVKTDNLFLEQVFDEFNQLLNLFSRIFLVVNLDSTKQDLMPDGSMVPSLESDDPIRVVEAFENLSMSQPLKAAADEGRLRIYPVDLINAAARRLANGHSQDETASEAKREPDGIASSGQADFDVFMRDLSDYLGSSEYLVAFLGDSLRRASTLLDEADQACRHASVQAIGTRMDTLEERRADTGRKLEALGRLADYDWAEALRGLERELREVGDREAAVVCERSSREVAAALDRWFEGDASLQSLLQRDLTPLVTGSQRSLALAVHGRLSEDVASGASGVALPHEVARDLFVLGIQWSEFGRGGLDGLDPVAGIEAGGPLLETADVPVKRSLWDWLLFRSRHRVQERLFGPAERPDRRVPRDLKAKRLGGEARARMESLLAAYQEERLPGELDALTRRIFDDYARAVVGALSERLASRETELEAERSSIEEELRRLRKVLNHVEELGMASARTRGAVDELAHRYDQADPDLLVQPVAPPPGRAEKTPANIAEAWVEESEPRMPAPETTPGIEIEIEIEDELEL